jgi:hypothetical protein
VAQWRGVAEWAAQAGKRVRGGSFLSCWGRRWIGRVKGSERGQGTLKVRDFRLFYFKKKKMKLKCHDQIFFFF